MRQRKNLLAPLAQRGNYDFDDVQPEEQVLPEMSLAHRSVEIAIRRRDDAHVGGASAGFPDALELLVLEEPEQLGLDGGRNLTDLVEEKRAPLRGFHAARLVADGPGESALDVAEHLACE